MSIRPVSWFRQAVRRGLAVSLPRRVYITHGPRRTSQLCLTFDDGPHPAFTPRLLDLLAEQRVPATFFVIGREAEKYPALVRRMISEGHAVGNHSHSHSRRESLSARQVMDDVNRGADVIGAIIEKRPNLFRPPGGKLTASDLWHFWRLGLTTVLWNVDPKDYNKQTADEVAACFRKRPLSGGDLALFHDNHPHAMEVLPDLIASARSRGLGFSTVDAWTGGQTAAYRFIVDSGIHNLH